MPSVILRLENLTKIYSGTTALESVSLDIYEGEFFGVIGPSGSGKSTLLKIVCGVEAPTSGHIVYNGRTVSPGQTNSGEIVMVWQSLALFPHMDVEGNVAFGLAVRDIEEEKRKTGVREALAMVALNGYEKRRVSELSGGEQQRVALARALVVRPTVLLLDEPLGALDAYLRGELQAELHKLHRDTGITFVMVTHDQSEALALSTRIAVINKGQIEQVGTPEEIMKCPRTPFVARFVGDKNVIEGELDAIIDGTYSIKTHLGILKAAGSVRPETKPKVGSRVAYVIEAADISPGAQYENKLKGTFLGAVLLGSSKMLRLELPNKSMLTYEVYGNRSDLPAVGEKHMVSWQSERAYIIPI